MSRTKKSRARDLAKEKEKENERRENGEKKPFIAEAELGACASCNGYHWSGPHQRNDLVVLISCIPRKRALVPAKTDIDLPEKCEFFPKKGHCR